MTATVLNFYVSRLKPHLRRDIVCDQTLVSFYQGRHVILQVCSYCYISLSKFSHPYVDCIYR